MNEPRTFELRGYALWQLISEDGESARWINRVPDIRELLAGCAAETEPHPILAELRDIDARAMEMIADADAEQKVAPLYRFVDRVLHPRMSLLATLLPADPSAAVSTETLPKREGA